MPPFPPGGPPLRLGGPPMSMPPPNIPRLPGAPPLPPSGVVPPFPPTGAPQPTAGVPPSQPPAPTSSSPSGSPPAPSQPSATVVPVPTPKPVEPLAEVKEGSKLIWTNNSKSPVSIVVKFLGRNADRTCQDEMRAESSKYVYEIPRSGWVQQPSQQDVTMGDAENKGRKRARAEDFI